MALRARGRNPAHPYTPFSPPPVLKVLHHVGVGSLVLIENLQPDCSTPHAARPPHAAGGGPVDKISDGLRRRFLALLGDNGAIWVTSSDTLLLTRQSEAFSIFWGATGTSRHRRDCEVDKRHACAQKAAKKNKKPRLRKNQSFSYLLLLAQLWGRWSSSEPTPRNISDQCNQAEDFSFMKPQAPAVKGRLRLPWKSGQIERFWPGRVRSV